MFYKQTTSVSNFVFDTYIPQLTEAELKVLLIVFRQTWGWLNKTTGKRKHRDRISHSQFQKKTGLSKRVISPTIQSLYSKQLIRVTNFQGQELPTPQERKGKMDLYYSPWQPVQVSTQASANDIQEAVQKGGNTEAKPAKANSKKLSSRFRYIGKVLANKSKYLQTLLPR